LLPVTAQVGLGKRICAFFRIISHALSAFPFHDSISFSILIVPLVTKQEYDPVMHIQALLSCPLGVFVFPDDGGDGIIKL
jgi:hypothetical protein